MKPSKKFKFPKAVLDQLNECSSGYFLAVINAEGEFEIHSHYDNSLQELGMLNFLDIQCSSTMTYIREMTIAKAIEDDDDSKNDPNEDDKE